MGFNEDAARRALDEASASGHRGDARLEAAINRLMEDPISACAAQCGSCIPPGGPQLEECECAICTETLELDNAAMRCSGQHGKRHYYHAQCLAQWIQQCRNDNVAPTCPECRGELQVRTQRLQDFLTERSATLRPEEREALRAVHDAAQAEEDSDGWSGIKKETVLKGIAIGALAVAGGVAVAALMGAFKKDGSKDRNQR